MVSTGLTILAQGDDTLQRTLNRLAIALKCEKIQIYGAYKEENLSFKHFSNEVLFELFLIANFAPALNFDYKCFAEISVPKYSNTAFWSITTKERNETEKEQEHATLFKNRFVHFKDNCKKIQRPCYLGPMESPACNFLSKL